MAQKKKKNSSGKSGLTDKQKRFCDEYLIDMNATQAAVRAGYSKKTAYRTGCDNLKKAQIRAYIDARMAEKESELIATQDEVLRYLTSVLRGESQSVEIVVESIGDGFSAAREFQKYPSEMERIKAADQLAKCYGLYADRQKMAADRERLELEKERLELEKRKVDAAEPDKDAQIIITGFDESWCD